MKGLSSDPADLNRHVDPQSPDHALFFYSTNRPFFPCTTSPCKNKCRAQARVSRRRINAPHRRRFTVGELGNSCLTTAAATPQAFLTKQTRTA